MSFPSTEAAEQSPFVLRAERALQSLKQNVTDHVARESRLRRVYGEWQETWLSRAEQLRQQISELEARLAPWMPRGESVRLAVVSRNEEAN
ncbi:MAG: hypothetical protein JSS49_06090 [Planctomycetes bacterium]|nr:hypothetical protein [Planctomycetota bacterium]